MGFLQLKNKEDQERKIILKALQNKGLNDIVELRYTDRKALVQDFTVEGNWQLIHTDKPILMTQIQYITNDSWEVVSGISGKDGWPILHMADYSKGKLYVLNIPDNFSDLYNLPPQALNKIREVLSGGLDISIEGPSDISLYLYDNKTFIVESFSDEDTILKIVTPGQYSKITDLSTNQSYTGEAENQFFRRNSNPRKTYGITLKPHSYRIFSYE